MLEIGTKVRVAVDGVKDNVTGIETIRPYNGMSGRISRLTPFKTQGAYYEVEGIVSKKGVPISFCEEWLKEVPDEVEET